MRNAWCWWFLSALLIPVGIPADGATYLHRKIFHEVQPDGSVLEGEEFIVRLENDADESWLSYRVWLDENIELDTITGSAVKPDGTTVRIDPEAISEIAAPGADLHGSARYKEVAFREVLPIGTTVRYQGVVKRKPYYPSGAIQLYTDDPVESLHVEIRGPANLRWKIDGNVEGLAVEEQDGTVVVTAESLPRRDELRWAPSGAALFPRLRYGWSDEFDWKDVGAWYHGLVSELPRRDETVLADARAVTSGIESEWEKLNRLVAFAQNRIRYVAVEVGIGGYKPSSPKETHERKWGDCKDKAILLIEMLEEAGIRAYPALVQSSLDGRIDPAFPSQRGFNHVIVAVEERSWMAGKNLAIAGGYLFVDPTQKRGQAEWLGPVTQDKHALVVRADGSELVLTPTWAEAESRNLNVDLTVSSNGSASGSVVYEISGSFAASLLQLTETDAPDSVEAEMQALMSRLFPAAQVSRVEWHRADDPLPGMTLKARVRLEGLVEGTGGRKSFQVTGLTRTPETSVLADREVPVVLHPLESEQTWRLRLPREWCPVSPKSEVAENGVGSFSHTVVQKDALVEVRRNIKIAQRWVEPHEFGALRELSLAEHRSNRRRIRLRCPDAS